MHWAPGIWFVFAICTAAATGSLARHRGRSFIPWFVLGTVGWFVAIPWLLFTKSQLGERTAPAGAATIASLAGGCAAAVFAGNLIWAPTVLPNCDYYANIAALNKVMSGKTAGTEIVTIANIKEISRSNSDIKCTGTARLGNSTDAPIDYRFYIQDGKLLSEARLQ